MDRLTERIDTNRIKLKVTNPMAITKLCDYEDAEEQGLLVRLPCKVGDRLYPKIEIFGPLEVIQIRIKRDIDIISRDFIEIVAKNQYSSDYYFNGLDIGKTVFLTKEEAEKALSEVNK